MTGACDRAEVHDKDLLLPTILRLPQFSLSSDMAMSRGRRFRFAKAPSCCVGHSHDSANTPSPTAHLSQCGHLKSASVCVAVVRISFVVGFGDGAAAAFGLVASKNGEAPVLAEGLVESSGPAVFCAAAERLFF